MYVPVKQLRQFYLSWEVCHPPLGKLMTLWWNLPLLCLYWPWTAPLRHLVKYEVCRAPHWRGDPERSSTSKVATTRPQLYQEADQSFLREYYTIRVGTHFVEVYWLLYDRNDLKLLSYNHDITQMVNSVWLSLETMSDWHHKDSVAQQQRDQMWRHRL